MEVLLKVVELVELVELVEPLSFCLVVASSRATRKLKNFKPTN